MFKLSERHNQAFQAKAEADFVREVMQYLRENHAETIVELPNGEFKVIDLPEETLRKMVKGGIAKARSYGMTWRSTLISFVVIMFVSAPNFYEHSKINKTLSKSKLIPDMRINKLWETTDELVWAEVGNLYNNSRWLN